MVGKKFGTWEVIGKYQNKSNRFLCKCECGFMTIKYQHEIEKPSSLSCMSCCKKNENTHFYGNKDNSKHYVGKVVDGDIGEYIVVALTDKDTFKDVPRDNYVYIHKQTKYIFINSERLKVTEGGIIFVLCNTTKNDTLLIEFDDKTRNTFFNLDTIIQGMKNTPYNCDILSQAIDVFIGYREKLLKSLDKYKKLSVDDIKKALKGGVEVKV